MYIIVKENKSYYPETINMDNISSITVDNDGYGTKKYGLKFFNTSGTLLTSYYVSKKNTVLELLQKINDGIKHKQKYVELEFS